MTPCTFGQSSVLPLSCFTERRLHNLCAGIYGRASPDIPEDKPNHCRGWRAEPALAGQSFSRHTEFAGQPKTQLR